MTRQRTIEDVLAEPATIDDVIKALGELADSVQAEPEEWENPTVDRYLRGMAAWLESVRGRIGDEPSWRFVIAALQAGKVYE